MFEYPEHVNDCVEDASDSFLKKESDIHKLFQIVCRCGSRAFNLWESNLKTVVAECSGCGARIVVYDLAFYPVAVKLTGEEQFREMSTQSKRPSGVFVRYEYGPAEDDVSFDRNDITWCQIYANTNTGRLVQVFDDETC